MEHRTYTQIQSLLSQFTTGLDSQWSPPASMPMCASVNGHAQSVIVAPANGVRTTGIKRSASAEL